jgi:hypothetical protein
MSETPQPPSLDQGVDDNFDKELIQMWQENACPLAADAELARQLAGWVGTFDRRIFWRNFREYAAAAVVIVGLACDAIFSDRLIAPLTGIAATLFVMSYLWWKHRGTQPLDPSADASAYRAALLRRYDQQIQLLRSARYWYVLPFWVFFLAVLGSGVIKLTTSFSYLAFFSLVVIFLILTALSLWLVWVNESAGVRALMEARRQAEAIITESTED